MNTSAKSIFLAVALGLATICTGEPALDTPANTETQSIELAKVLYEHRDGILAFQLFSKLAEQGDIEATAWLGRCFFNGVGAPVDHARAFQCFAKAAEAGNAWGMNGLAVCYKNGFGTTKDMQASFQWFERAAQADLPVAVLNLAIGYTYGTGEFHNDKKAEEYYRRAIALDAPDAKGRYGIFLYVNGRPKEAIPYMRQARNNSLCASFLSECYANGRGTDVDLNEALNWAEQAARLDPRCEQDAGELLFGMAVEEKALHKETDKYLLFLRRAADYGHGEAQMMYARHLQSKNDPDQALRYLEKAANQGVHTAELEAGKLHHSRENSYSAIQYLLRAVQHPATEAEAAAYLAIIYRDEQDDMPRSHHWALRGCELGNTFCMNEIALWELFSPKSTNPMLGAALLMESFYDGNENAKNIVKAEWPKLYDDIRSAADKGNGDALLALGLLGAAEAKDHPNFGVGMALLEKAVKAGNGRAAWYLGRILCEGRKVKQDRAKGLDWYRKGAELGDLDCARDVVMLLYYGDDFQKTPLEEVKQAMERCLTLGNKSVAFEYGELMEFKAKNVEEAKRLYQIAINQEDSRAWRALARLTQKENAEEAMTMLKIACSLRDGWAALEMADRKNDAGEPRQAFIALQNAWQWGNENCAIAAMNRLALCHLYGFGCPVNVELGLRVADNSYQRGSADICAVLGGLYEEGKLVARDQARARKYYEEGAKRGSEECKKKLK